MKKIDLEICCADIESVMAAKDGGADRIELCTALELGGLTPSAGLIASAVEIMGGEKVNVLIRQRPGDFVYSSAEIEVMERDMEAAVGLGVKGLVVGALTASNKVNVEVYRHIRNKFPDVTLTFHRAFDLVAEPMKALEEIIALGFDRVLTSGLAEDALTGADIIRQLVDRADGRLTIMAGCGVTAGNIAEIVKKTEVKDVHASAKHKIKSRSNVKRGDVAMGVADNDDERYVTSAEKVKELKRIIS